MKKIEEMTAVELLEKMDSISEYCGTRLIVEGTDGCRECPLYNHCQAVDGDPGDWFLEGFKKLVNAYMDEVE